MKKIDRIFREVLHRHHTRGARFFNQKKLAKLCQLSLGTVNPVVAKLEQIGAVVRRPFGFRLTEPKRLLTYWAATRELAKDICYTTFSPARIPEIEEELARLGCLTAYSAYKRHMKQMPIDYLQVFVYANPNVVKRAFSPSSREKKNIIVLEGDEHLRRLSRRGVVPLVQAYVDLWQLGAPASRLVEELEREISAAPSKALREVAMALRGELEASGGS
jgi:hypothetical protein